MLLFKRNLIPLLVILFTVIVFVAVCLIAPNMVQNPVKISFNKDADSIVLKEGWKVLNEQGVYENVKSLPTKDLPTSEGVLTLVNTIPEYKDPVTVLIRSSMQSVKVYIDGAEQPLITEGDDTTQFIGKTLGSRWSLFRLPSECSGKQIKIELYSPIENFVGRVSDIVIGSKVSNMYYVGKTHGVTLLVSAFIFQIGLVMTIIFFCMGNKNTNLNAIYLGLFFMLAALWIAGESRMLQFFFDNQFYVTKVAYIGLMLFPLPVTMYVKNAFEKRVRHIEWVFFWLFTVNFFVCLTLQLTGVADFYETIFVNNVILALFVLYSVGASSYEYVKYKNVKAGEFLLSVAVLAVFGIAEFVAFFADALMYTSKVFSIGMLIYVVLMGARTIMEMRQISEKSIKSDYYSKLAYTDLLTSCKNRNAYYEDTANVFAKATDKDNIWLAVFDLNGLKKINDKYGHKAGDSALIMVAKAINDNFAPFVCYRTGGDEFVCIVFDKDEKYLQRCIRGAQGDLLKERIKDIPITIAVGYANYNQEDITTFDALSSIADKHMYENKKKMAESSHTMQ